MSWNMVHFLFNLDNSCMRIFEINEQDNDVQSLNFANNGLARGGLLEFQCRPELKRWKKLNPLFMSLLLKKKKRFLSLDNRLTGL